MTPRQLALRFRDAAIRDGFANLKGLQVRVTDWSGFTGRTFGACTQDGSEILLAPDLAGQPDDIIEGVVAHELGHALDFSYPAGWITRHGEAVLADGQVLSLRRWRRRGHDTVERMADRIAQAVFGATIRYRGCMLLQSTQAGVHPRPAGL